MTDDKDRESDAGGRTESAEPDREDDARRIILARRARFVAAALASAGIATAACGGETSGDGAPEPCLSIGASGGQYNDGGTGGAQATTGGRTGSGGMPMPCLSPPLGGMYGAGGMPQPCLDVVPTGGAGGGPSDGGPGATDAGPAPLDAAIPVPCLSIPQFEGPKGDGEGS